MMSGEWRRIWKEIVVTCMNVECPVLVLTSSKGRQVMNLTF